MLFVVVCKSSTHRDYEYVPIELNWFDAQMYCIDTFNSTLATIITNSEYLLAQNILRNIDQTDNPIGHLWIGLENLDTNSGYQWSDGSICEIPNNNGECTSKWVDGIAKMGPCVQLDLIEDGFISVDCVNIESTFLCNKQTISAKDIGCNYINIQGHGFIINDCNIYKYYDAMSYQYKCDYKNDVKLIYYYDSDTCMGNVNETINSDAINITDYSCDYKLNELNAYDASCGNTMDIKWYIHDWSKEENGINQDCIKNESLYYKEKRILNQCLLISEHSNEYVKWECYDDYYVSTVYSDSECTQFIQDQRYNKGECVNGLIQIHQCNTIETPETTTTAIITTETADNDDDECDYVNFDGISRRIDVCHPAPMDDDGIFFYEFQCDDNPLTPIVRYWWRNVNGCVGQPFAVDSFTNNDITSYHCTSSDVNNVCDSNDVLMIKQYNNNKCMINDNDYTISDVLINKCFIDNNNGSKYIECNIDNNNEHNSGYIIYNYDDNNCNNLRIKQEYSSIECINNNLEILIWCSGVINDIDANLNQCEYFMNNKNNRGNLIHSINTCNTFRISNGYFSNKYECNLTDNTINEIWYSGGICNETQKLDTYVHTKLDSNFYCNDIPYINQNDDAQCDNSNNLLEIRWYNRDTLTSNGDCMKKKGFYHDNYLITNACIPDHISTDNGDIIYTLIECDQNDLDWFKISYYNDDDCNEQSELDSLRFEHNQCISGDIMTIMGCRGNMRDHDSSESSSSSSSS